MVSLHYQPQTGIKRATGVGHFITASALKTTKTVALNTLDNLIMDKQAKRKIWCQEMNWLSMTPYRLLSTEFVSPRVRHPAAVYYFTLFQRKSN